MVKKNAFLTEISPCIPLMNWDSLLSSSPNPCSASECMLSASSRNDTLPPNSAICCIRLIPFSEVRFCGGIPNLNHASCRKKDWGLTKIQGDTAARSLSFVKSCLGNSAMLQLPDCPSKEKKTYIQPNLAIELSCHGV